MPPRTSIFCRSSTGSAAPSARTSSHETPRHPLPPRPHPLRHLGQQLLPRLADLGAGRGQHRPVRRRGDEPHPGPQEGPKSNSEYLVIGSTVPWHWKFWNAPLVASCLGRRIPGLPSRAGLRHRAPGGHSPPAQVESGPQRRRRRVLTFDRTSDSPVGVFPERRAHQRTTTPSADVWDNFGFDPATGKAMIVTAAATRPASTGSTAKRWTISPSASLPAVLHRQGEPASSTGCSCPSRC